MRIWKNSVHLNIRAHSTAKTIAFPSTYFDYYSDEKMLWLPSVQNCV